MSTWIVASVQLKTCYIVTSSRLLLDSTRRHRCLPPDVVETRGKEQKTSKQIPCLALKFSHCARIWLMERLSICVTLDFKGRNMTWGDGSCEKLLYSFWILVISGALETYAGYLGAMWKDHGTLTLSSFLSDLFFFHYFYSDFDLTFYLNTAFQMILLLVPDDGILSPKIK